MRSRRATFLVAALAMVGGLCLHTYQFGGRPDKAFLIALMAWSFLPYVICGIVLFGLRHPWPAAMGGWLVLVADFRVHEAGVPT